MNSDGSQEGHVQFSLCDFLKILSEKHEDTFSRHLTDLFLARHHHHPDMSGWVNRVISLLILG